MRNKLKFEFVKKYFEEQKCLLLETEYIGALHKMRYICNCGQESMISWANFTRGYRCDICGHERTGNKKRLKDVANYFKEQNCILLDHYKNANTPLKYICSCGNEDKIRFSKFKMGQRCRKCKYEKIKQKGKLRIGPLNARWNPDREKVELNKLMHQKFYSMLSNILKATEQKKTCRSAEMLGYSRKQLKEYLISHPDWHQTKNTRWSIDHIYPIKAFIEHGITDIKLINCLENLRPMELSKNLSKHDKYDKTEFQKWLAKKQENATI